VLPFYCNCDMLRIEMEVGVAGPRTGLWALRCLYLIGSPALND
jgi:hypothetical protein